MNMQVTDWQAHYKAVRYRIQNPPNTDRDRLAMKLYDAPIGPDRAKPMTRYAATIGPVRPIEAVYIGWVVYGKPENFLRRVRYHAHSIRPRHHLDSTRHAHPIGPHNSAKSVRVKQEPTSKRDFLHVATDRNNQYVPASRRIIDEVCAEHNIRQMDLISRRRTSDFALVRHKICYRLKKETPLSFPSIGRLLKRDHTSVIRGVRRWQALLDAAAPKVEA